MRRDAATERSVSTRLVIVALLVVLSIPLVIALVVLRHPRWYPYADSAALEMRLRDIWTGNSPLVGAVGRFGNAQASHPGPLGFYALWPFYRIAGESAWAMAVAAVALQIAAMAMLLWIAVRRGGALLAIAMAGVIAVLVHGYGASLLADAWNPFVPLLWWLVFLLAIWSVLCDDVVLLPVAVAAGSLCAQCHVSYVASAVVLGGFAVVWAVVRAHRAEPPTTDRLRRWLIVAAVIGVLLWLPPLVDELWDTGNFTAIWDAFTDDSQVALGFGRGAEILLIYLNPWSILSHDLGREKIEFASGSYLPGLILGAVWAAAAVVAWKLGDRPLRRLHLVLALSVVLAFVSCSRVVGGPLSYLFLWIWGIGALMLLAIGWTAFLVVDRVRSDRTARRATMPVAIAVAGLILLMIGLAAKDATDAQIDDPQISRELGILVRPTVTALHDGDVPGGGTRGRYLVGWVDPLNFGLQGFGLMNELERQGFEVGTSDFYRGVVTPHRVLDPKQATAVVHLAVGAEIRTWEAKRGARRVAYYDRRTRAERSEYRRLRAQVVEEVIEAGLRDQVHLVDENLVTLLYYGAQLTPETRARMKRMIDLGLDQAVFVAPIRADTT